jgi:hypothetical protein
MSSKADICNLALLKIGVAPVDLDDEESPIAQALNTIYEPSRLKLLRLHNWHFASLTNQIEPLFDGHHIPNGTSRRHALFGPSRFIDDTRPPYTRRKFALPADFIRLIHIVYPYRIPYELEHNNLICNAYHVRIKYVADVHNPNLFDPLFLDCLAHLIGAQTAYLVSGAESKGQALKQEFEILLRDAKRIDSQDNGTRPFINADDLFFSRLDGGYIEGI